MSGGKGGSQSVEIPEYIESAMKRNLSRAEDVQGIGYSPYYGPSVAAFSPAQEQAMKTKAQMAQNYGVVGSDFDVMSGVPGAQDFGNGMWGYSYAPLFEQAVGAWGEKNPQQLADYNALHNTPLAGTPQNVIDMVASSQPTPDQQAQQQAQMTAEDERRKRLIAAGLLSEWDFTGYGG